MSACSVPVRCALILWAGLMVPLGQAGHEQGSAATLLTKKDLVAKLRHEENLVRSVKAEFEVIHRPTPLDLIPKIKAVYRKAGKERNYREAVFSAELAASPNWSYRTVWWRKGEKERSEKYARDSARSDDIRVHVEAIDGAFVRQLNEKDKVAAIDTRTSAHWDQNGSAPIP